jgi:hypothetical protein
MGMQCDDIDALLIEYLDHKLSPAMRTSIEKHLQTCEACRQSLEEYKTLFRVMHHDKQEQPGPLLQEKFENMLQSEINIHTTEQILQKEREKEAKTTKKPVSWWRIAASIILVVGGILVGMKIVPHQQDDSRAQIAKLNKEVQEIKEALMFNLLNDESASERLKAVNYVEEMVTPDKKIVAALINTLNTDKNVNVRLAALNAISKFSGSQAVRDSLVASLGKQTEPIMQIVLINMLTESRERKARAPIEKILEDKNVLPPVKEIAEKGLKQL